MQLRVTRTWCTPQSTIGELTVDGVFECFTLEDPVRPQKIARITAIPAGAYEVAITPSARFQCNMPLLRDVPEFEGVRVHWGNTAENTDGCLLVGKIRRVDFIGQSRDAYKALYAKIEAAERRNEAVTITIINAGTFPSVAATDGVVAVSTAHGTRFRVTADPLRLRTSPDASRSDNIVGRLPFGQIVTQSGMSDVAGWINVTTELAGQQLEGFVSSSFLEVVPRSESAVEVSPAAQPEATTPGELYRVKATKLNLREEPANMDDEAIVGVLPHGLLLTKRGESPVAFWWEVEALLDGQRLHGFVNRTFLEAESGPAISPTATQASVGSAPMEVQCTEKACQLILSSEGLNQPGQWPGKDSGITIGMGYDLGYHTHDEFFTDWAPHLSIDVMRRLAEAIGVRGVAAENLASHFMDITIARPVSERVFIEQTLPDLKQKAAKAFPGITKLPPDVQGSLVSLIYNRGTSMAQDPQDTLDRRREMRDIRDVIARNDLSMAATVESIARSLESMKRLWVNQGVDGLLSRRDAEATLVRSAIV